MSAAGDELRAVLSRAAADPSIGPEIQRLIDLLDRALAEAETAGVRYLARSIPHELAQPLSEIRGYAELLAHHDYPPDQRSTLLDRVSSAASRLGEMVHAVGSIADPDRPAPQRRKVAGHLLVEIQTSAPVDEPPEPATAVDELRLAAAGRLGLKR